jgi:transitional endoplasmic reticulum ATPase
MQEAHVAALLAIARKDRTTTTTTTTEADDTSNHDMEGDWIGVGETDGDDDDLDKYILWVNIKKQVEILRKGLIDGLAL